MKEYNLAVLVGRFQPFHNGHLEVVTQGLELADKLLIIVGSSGAAPTIKNPFTFEERKNFILSSLDDKQKSNVIVRPIRDYHNTDQLWVSDVLNKINEASEGTENVCLIGNYKDSSSYYLKYFPQFDFRPITTKSNIDATTIRNSLFKEGKILHDLIPEAVSNFLLDFVYEKANGWSDADNGVSFSKRMSKLQNEYKFIETYKLRHKFVDSTITYDPIFMTVDTVVICSGHVLCVKRKFNPGMDLYALPGGFIKSTERLKDAAIRELKEETGIKVDKNILENSIVESNLFDYPNRSLRGRTITNAYLIRLKDGRLPEVKGNDDASKAFWLPISDVSLYSEQFFEDHASIINYFLYRA